MLRAILNKSWRQQPTRHQLYGHLPPITKTIQVRRTRHAGHCRRSRDEFISDIFLWTPTYGQAKAGRPARTYIQQLCEDMGCGPEDLPEAMNDREKWRERVRDIRASSSTWWWWWYVHSNNYKKKTKLSNGQLFYPRVVLMPHNLIVCRKLVSKHILLNFYPMQLTCRCLQTQRLLLVLMIGISSLERQCQYFQSYFW